MSLRFLGNVVDMAEMLPHIPSDRLAFGNVDPAASDERLLSRTRVLD